MVAEMRANEAVNTLRDMQAKLAARRLVDARAMLAEVKAATAEVEAEFTAFAQDNLIETVTLQDGTLVTLIEADRRKIDAKVLADILPKSIFDIVTDAKVNHKRFDAAVTTGLVSDEQAEDAVTKTPYTRILVTE